MSKRAFIVHGWDGSPDKDWLPWLRTELMTAGFEVRAPLLPNAETPHIETWVPALAEAVGTADSDTYFVGHSMGCQTIIRYLASLPEGIAVGGAVFVAGFVKQLTHEDGGLLTETEDEEQRMIAKEWLETPLDLNAVHAHLPKSVAILSDNDPYVPLEEQTHFRDGLGSTIVIEHGKDHFNGEDGITELPSALDAVLRLSAK